MQIKTNMLLIYGKRKSFLNKNQAAWHKIKMIYFCALHFFKLASHNMHLIPKNISVLWVRVLHKKILWTKHKFSQRLSILWHAGKGTFFYPQNVYSNVQVMSPSWRGGICKLVPFQSFILNQGKRLLLLLSTETRS